jgi:hypothetical protein
VQAGKRLALAIERLAATLDAEEAGGAGYGARLPAG